jgi:hypothetical protein
MNTLLSTASPSFSAGEVAVLFWATIGGICVFIGLMLEKFAEWMDDRFLGGSHKPHKTLESAGWCILMLGIFVEITVAFWSANDAWQTRQMAIKNDPLNQPIAVLTANAFLIEQGTNRTKIDPGLPLGGAVFVKLHFRCSKRPESGSAVLICTSCVTYPMTTNSPPTLDNNDGICWRLQFSSTGLEHFGGVIPPKSTVRDASGWDEIEFDAPFLPPNTEIWGGNITLSVNSSANLVFEIPPQRVEKAEIIQQDSLGKKVRVFLTKPVTVISW